MADPELELLRLLAEDASAARIQSESAPAEARNLALRVRGMLDAHRSREAALSALVDTARDLASMRDPGGVLVAIVRRARALIGTDVAYLTLYDPERGDTYMRATDGSVSARFQSLRLSLGAGLGGLVAQTRLPYTSPDYPNDPQFRHTSEIDTAVGEEGLTAICGTPLLVDGEFVGVLFAANRSRRPFSPEEVALLGSLAALAAVSLLKARREAETREALAALSEAHESVRRHTAGVERAAEAHEEFSQVALSGGGIDHIATALADLLACWVVILDPEGQPMAVSGKEPPDPAGLPDEAAVRASAGTGRLANADGMWAVVVQASGQPLGTLVLGGHADLDPADQRTAERAALVAALVLLYRREAAESEQRVRSDLLADLLAGGDPGSLTERGRVLGLRLHAPHHVAVCPEPSADRRRGLQIAASHALDGRGLTGEYGGDVVILIPADDGRSPSAAAADLAARLGRVTVGAAGPMLPLEALAPAYDEASRTAAALLALGLSGRGAATDDLGFAGLVLAGEPDVAAYLRRTLGPLLDYDERRGSELVETVEAYFGSGGSPRRTAAALHVHTNTVVQRLDRVATLLGAGWQEPDRSMELQLALRLRRLRA